MKKIFASFATSLAMIATGQAVSVSINFDPSQAPTVEDAAYNDGESAVFRAITSDPRVVATLSGRDFLQDPLLDEVWGVIDNSKPWNEGRAGWLIRQGWESSVVGVPVNHHPDGDVPAAYLLLRVNRPEDLIFDDITVSIENPRSVSFINTWVTSSADNFGSFNTGVPLITPNANSLSLSLSNLNYRGTEPLEIRIYGVLGEDDGSFGIRSSLEAHPVPESGSLLMIAGAGLVMLQRRRRK